MDLSWIWQTIFIYIVGLFILRIGGRKSISQMTIAQTIVMIGLGTLLIQPVTGKGLFITVLIATVLVISMIIIEYLSMKVDFLENLFSGKALVVIENGVPNIANLKKIRMSIDKLEARLRQLGISSIEDIQYATIETSGKLGYELKNNKKPLTKEDFIILMNEAIGSKVFIEKITTVDQNQKNNIFKELYTDKFEGNKNEP